MNTQSKLIRPKVLFFDVNETLLDLTPLKKEVGVQLSGREDLLPLWFTTMLQYSLVLTAGRKYEHFEDIGAAALQMVAATYDIKISKEEAKMSVGNTVRRLPAHHDVKPSLTTLKKSGYTLVAISNSSIQSLHNQLEFAELTSYFDDILSVESIKKFKPSTEVYTWASEKMSVIPNESMLVAAHSWDVAGAYWAGWRTTFVQRQGKQVFPLAPQNEIVVKGLEEAANILVGYRKNE